ncbi:esterase/lipase family protein [Pseudomonas sp. XS1P51]
MTITIRGLPQPEPLPGTSFRLFAPGYRGRVKNQNLSPATRAGRAGLSLLTIAADAEITVMGQLDIELTSYSRQQSGNRGQGSTDPQVIVAVQDGFGYAALHTNEQQQSVWLFPVAHSKRESAFVLPNPDDESDSGRRGPLTVTMRCLVSVVCWAISPLTHASAEVLTRHWEAGKRPYDLLQVQSDGEFIKPCWETFTPGPALLLIHGTFSTPQVGFSGWLGSPAYQAMVKRYHGRVLALAHPSLSASLQENIDWLLQQLPPHVVKENTFDIVSHSRGGLVARELVSRAEKGLRVERVCQVGTPNEGTPLADIQHWTRFLNAHTSCLNALPDTMTTVMLEALLCLVKIIGAGLTGGLPGLKDMDPASLWLQDKHIGNGQTAWFTVGAAYNGNQADDGLMAHLKASAIDGFFGVSNDLVVPSQGCHQSVQQATDSLLLEGGETNHCNYFQSAHVHSTLSRWLI